MNSQDMLKGIVQEMFKGGKWQDTDLKFKKVSVFEIYEGENEAFNLMLHFDGGTMIHKLEYSFPDLIMNRSAMVALFGEELYCIKAGILFDKTCLLKDGGCAFCSRMPDGQALRAFVYHSTKAAKILLLKGQKEAIKYIYEELNK